MSHLCEALFSDKSLNMSKLSGEMRFVLDGGNAATTSSCRRLMHASRQFRRPLDIYHLLLGKSSILVTYNVLMANIHAI